MSSAWTNLEDNIGARRARASEASTLVAALSSRTSHQVAETITPWLQAAYGLEVIEVLPEVPAGDRRILQDPSGHRLLLITLNGSAYPNWQHVSDAAGWAWAHHVDSVAIASYMGSDEDLQKEAQDNAVKLWSGSELEVIYREMEFETGGVSIFA